MRHRHQPAPPHRREPQSEAQDAAGDGQRNRAHLASTLTADGNVILPDEPTNDLDIETLQSRQDAPEQFAGCAVVIL